jgi:pimeloyl-ACP methyl ester carboxylesterase
MLLGEHLARVPGTLSAIDSKYEAWWISNIALNSSEGLTGYAEFLSSLDTHPVLSEISVSMLILAPAKIAATGLEEQLQIARQMKGSKLVIIHGAGHEVYADKPEGCLGAFKEFLFDLDVWGSTDIS